MPRKNPPRTQRRRGQAAPPLLDHPGVAAAHAGPVTPAECDHPKGRRDAKNPNLCRACGQPVPGKPGRGA